MKDIIIVDRVKHNGIGYKILTYARFRSRIEDGTFSVEDYLKFRFHHVRPSDVKRAAETLVRNGHMQKIGTDKYQYVETGVLFKLNSAHKTSMYENQQVKKTKKFLEDDDDDLF